MRRSFFSEQEWVREIEGLGVGWYADRCDMWWRKAFFFSYEIDNVKKGVEIVFLFMVWWNSTGHRKKIAFHLRFCWLCLDCAKISKIKCFIFPRINVKLFPRWWKWLATHKSGEKSFAVAKFRKGSNHANLRHARSDWTVDVFAPTTFIFAKLFDMT